MLFCVVFVAKLEKILPVQYTTKQMGENFCRLYLKKIPSCKVQEVKNWTCLLSHIIWFRVWLFRTNDVIRERDVKFSNILCVKIQQFFGDKMLGVFAVQKYISGIDFVSSVRLNKFLTNDLVKLMML